MDDKDKAKQTNGRNCWFGWWALSRQRVVCLAAGTASLLLVLVAFIFELREEGHSVRLVAIAAVFVLQAVYGALLWKHAASDRTHPANIRYQQMQEDTRSLTATAVVSRLNLPHHVSNMQREMSLARVSSSQSLREREYIRRISGDAADTDIRSSSTVVMGMEQGVVSNLPGRFSGSGGDSFDCFKVVDPRLYSLKAAEGPSRSCSNLRSNRKVAVVSGEDDEAAFTKHVALETPLQQAARTLEFVLDKYSPDARTTEKLEMVLNIISLPEDLNTVTMQSIMNADLDSSTTEWMEAQLSPQATVVSGETGGEMTWGRLRDGLRGVVHRMAKEVVDGKRDLNGTGTGMTTEQLRRQQEVGRAYMMEKVASGRSRQTSTTINISQLMTLPGARVRPNATLTEVDERSFGAVEEDDTEEKSNAKQAALMQVLPTWPGIAPDAQKSVMDLITTEHFLDWRFDVFKLHELSAGHALWYTGILTVYHYNYVGVFSISPLRLSNFLVHVEHNYCFDPAKPNPYHTSVHAADVTLTVAHFCENERIASGIKALQGFALVVAAIVHDYRHRGVNNGFLIKVGDSLAITYNDSSVLENFHLSEAFRVLYDDRFNILEGLTADEHRHFRQFLIKIVLATDLAHGFEYVSRFSASTNTKGNRKASIVPDMAREGSTGGGTSRGAGGAGSSLSAGKDLTGKDPLQAQILLMQMVMKVADVAHPMKPWELHERWTNLITEEFHTQGDLEAKRGVPMSPLCRREGHNPAKSQCDFINFVVRPCATVFSAFSRETLWVATLDSNYRRWSEML